MTRYNKGVRIGKKVPCANVGDIANWNGHGGGGSVRVVGLDQRPAQLDVRVNQGGLLAAARTRRLWTAQLWCGSRAYSVVGILEGQTIPSRHGNSDPGRGGRPSSNGRRRNGPENRQQPFRPLIGLKRLGGR